MDESGHPARGATADNAAGTNPGEQHTTSRERFTTTPREIDAIMRRLWTKSYNGNVDDHNPIVRRFLHKYRKHISLHSQLKCEAITGEAVKEACDLSQQPPHGMDVMEPQEIIKRLPGVIIIWKYLGITNRNYEES